MSDMNTPRLSFDWTRAQDVCPVESKMSEHFAKVCEGSQSLLNKTGAGADFTGWTSLLEADPAAALSPSVELATRIAQQSDAVVVVGIGGSNLGAKAVFDALSHSYAADLPPQKRSAPQLYWAGNHLATDEAAELLDALEGHTPSLIVISKSGTTTEPALAFRILKSYMDQRFGVAESAARIFCVTDPKGGTLKKLADENDWPRLEIPPDVGGRYSVFTPCGLLPLAAAGIDVEAFVTGARDAGLAATRSENRSLETNPALCYAALRNALYSEGYKVEAHCTWTPKLRTVSEWWKQLFGESDAKENSGLYPASACFTTDLHSLGQYFQDGERHLFATHIKILKEASVAQGALARSLTIPKAAGLNDGFEFLNGKELSLVQHHAQEATFLAHADGKCPTVVWNLPERNAYWLGYWMYSQMIACAVGGYARGINPFDQPGVEDYKRNMFALIGKSGFESKRDEIQQRIERGRRLQSFGPTAG